METTLNTTSTFRYFDWDKTKTFFYVAQLGSFTKASAFLHLSQPALSRQIQSLERSLGVPLFIRQSRGLILTRKGEELHRIIKSTFQQLKDFTQETQKIECGEQRTLRMGLPASLMFPVFSILTHYLRSRAYLTLELIEDIPSKEMILLDLDMALRPFQKNLTSAEQITFGQINERLLSDSVKITREEQHFVPFCFVIPPSLKADEDVQGILHALSAGLRNAKKDETELRYMVFTH
jgi:DNA-binding transcriptional LysR family regulator